MHQEIVSLESGSSPVMLVVRHDGEKTSLNGRPLPFNHDSKPRDANTADIAWRTVKFMAPFGVLPTYLRQMVKRQYLNPEVEDLFTDAVTTELIRLKRLHPRILLLDLHGFGEANADDFLKQYDLVFGTRHRETTPMGEDRKLGSYLETSGYRVYVPGQEPVVGERFAALEPNTLMGILSRKGFFPENTAVQIEISHQHRNGDFELKDRLAKALGEFLLNWSNGSS